jgi:hypothetical protein
MKAMKIHLDITSSHGNKRKHSRRPVKRVPLCKAAIHNPSYTIMVMEALMGMVIMG